MRLLLLCERRSEFPLLDGDPKDMDSELLSEQEEDQLLSGLRDAGHEVQVTRSLKDLARRSKHWRARTDLVINRSAGFRGNERTLIAPAVLTHLEFPYLGSTPYVHALVRNKAHTKLVVAHAGVSTPPFALYEGGVRPDLTHLWWPSIVKPLAESASIGIDHVHSIVRNAADALERAQYIVDRYQQTALIESFIAGTEVEVPIVTDPTPRALGAVALTLGGRIVDGEQFLAASDVYNDGYGFGPVPSTVDIERVQEAATTAARSLGIRDYGRVDFRVTSDGTPYLIEANTLPHVQRHSSFFHLAALRGRGYHEMLGEIIEAALARYRSTPPRA